MQWAGGLSLAVLFASSGLSQGITRNFGSVVFPGGTSSTNPNITRSFGSVVFPGGSPTSPMIRGGSPQVTAPPAFYRPGAPGNSRDENRGGNRRDGRRSPVVYYYPVFIGGSFGPGYYDGAPFGADAIADQPPMAAPPAPAYPLLQQQPQEAPPVIYQNVPPDEADAPPQTAPQDPIPSHYLIAFKDHTVYSAVAYWFEGDTLHYFTNGSTHNQVSVSLIDRSLTERLNRKMGVDFRLPPAQ